MKAFNLPSDAVAIEYSEARRLLDGVPLIDAARFYTRHHGKGIKRKSVGVAVDEMIERKTTKGVSKLYLDDLRYRLGVFNETFQCDLSTLRTFFKFTQRHDWLSKEVDLLARVEKRNGKPTPVEIFPPSELAEPLKHASPLIALCIGLSAFAGLRAEEILRLDWPDVERRPGFIEVAAHKAKTATRRIVPITDNLSRWFAKQRYSRGAGSNSPAIATDTKNDQCRKFYVKQPLASSCA